MDVVLLLLVRLDRVCKDNCKPISLIFLTEGPCSVMVICDRLSDYNRSLVSREYVRPHRNTASRSKIVPSNLSRILMEFRRLLNV